MKYTRIIMYATVVSAMLVAAYPAASATTTTTTSWETENSYWRSNYPSRSYYSSSRSYTTYEPAYRYGVDLYNQNPSLRYEDLNQAQLSAGWSRARTNSDLNWNDAQMATRDAYSRLYQSRSGMSGTTTSTVSGSATTMSTSTTNSNAR